MKPIQVILIVLFVVVMAKYLGWFRSRLLDRFILIVLCVLGIVLTLLPELTTVIALLIGVGRGVDLGIYMSLFGLGFFCVLLYAKARSLETKLAEVSRAFALKTAKMPRNRRLLPGARSMQLLSKKPPGVNIQQSLTSNHNQQDLPQEVVSNWRSPSEA